MGARSAGNVVIFLRSCHSISRGFEDSWVETLARVGDFTLFSYLFITVLLADSSLFVFFAGYRAGMAICGFSPRNRVVLGGTISKLFFASHFSSDLLHVSPLICQCFHASPLTPFFPLLSYLLDQRVPYS